MTDDVRHYTAATAWLSREAGLAHNVTISIQDGRILDVRVDDPAPPAGATRLPGFVLPGMINGHSHAFHRALRGRTHSGRGDFWSWRDQMYTVVDRLNPETFRRLARATYAEMALAGITTVVEFHYLHHDSGGSRYARPSTMDEALIAAAADAGIRLVLLNTCYLQADTDGTRLSGPQLRFGDRSVDEWAARSAAITPGGTVTLGAAIHSVRACPPDAMSAIAAHAREQDWPLHIHLSEQVRENEACLAAHGRTPAGVCADTGVLGPHTTAVHATHLTDDDIRLLGGTGTIANFCPTTERDLADGIGPAQALRDAGSPLSLGSDSHAIIDLFEEARGVELDERLATMRRGHHTAAELLTAATEGGAASAGFARPDGRIEAGGIADFIAVDTDSVRLAGSADPVAATVFAATASDVSHVVVGGRLVVDGRVHTGVPDVSWALTEAVRTVYRD